MFTVFRANHKCQLLLEIFCLIAVINSSLGKEMEDSSKAI